MLKHVGEEEMMRKISAVTLYTVLVLVACSCGAKPKFQVGDYVMPRGATNIDKIVKIVAADSKTYKVFPHMLVSGRLIESQDYKPYDRKQFERDSIKVVRPQVDDTFSVDRWLSENQGTINTN